MCTDNGDSVFYFKSAVSLLAVKTVALESYDVISGIAALRAFERLYFGIKAFILLAIYSPVAASPSE